MIPFCNWTPGLFASQLHTLYWLPSECSDAAAYCCKVYKFNATDLSARKEAHKILHNREICYEDDSLVTGTHSAQFLK